MQSLPIPHAIGRSCEVSPWPAEVPPPTAGAWRGALSALEGISEAPQLWFELAIERGKLQFLDNVHIAHYRSAFEDGEDPEPRRHLVRTWHRNRGARSYDG